MLQGVVEQATTTATDDLRACYAQQVSTNRDGRKAGRLPLCLGLNIILLSVAAGNMNHLPPPV